MDTKIKISSAIFKSTPLEKNSTKKVISKKPEKIEYDVDDSDADEELQDLDDDRICPYCQEDFSLNKNTDRKEYFQKHKGNLG